MNTRHTCSMRGVCELDQQGRHPTLAACQLQCSAASQRDVLLLIYRNNLGDAALLAPSDREAILFGLTSRRYPASQTRAILQGLDSVNVIPLLDYEPLVAYAALIWDPQVLRTALLNSGDLRALTYLQHAIHQLTREELEQFARAALFAGNADAITELYRLGHHELLRSLDDVYLQPNITPRVIDVMFEYDGDHISYYIPSAARQHLQNFLDAALTAGYTSLDEIEEYGYPVPLDDGSDVSDDEDDNLMDQYDYSGEEDSS